MGCWLYVGIFYEILMKFYVASRAFVLFRRLVV